ncbi:hypothetical protein ZOSMA_5670G00010, partial [Zostera marina]
MWELHSPAYILLHQIQRQMDGK